MKQRLYTKRLFSLRPITIILEKVSSLPISVFPAKQDIYTCLFSEYSAEAHRKLEHGSRKNCWIFVFSIYILDIKCVRDSRRDK